MTILEIIDKKRYNKELTHEEILFTINGFLSGTIYDYQMSSLLMAIVLNGMTLNETINLTDIMLNSGDIIDLSFVPNVKIDKHSTGGVGDKTTLVLAPLVASTGVTVAKMSGRGLGHTGGTIDKLEAITGFNTNLTEEQFKNQIKDIKIAITGQTGNLVPADKKIYALRDVTGTVSSIPLIASSIMSKKIASGADKIVLDVKVGDGALVNDLDSATKLSELMIKIGKKYDREVVCYLTNMDEPLGYAIGNGLEVIESINCLKGNGPTDLTDLVLTIGAEMIKLAKGIDYKDAYNEAKTNLESGKAMDKFEQLIRHQDGDLKKINVSTKVFSIKSTKDGYIANIDALKLGDLAKSIGAGRTKKDEKINLGVGFVLNKKVGDYISKDEELLKVYLDDKDLVIASVLNCFEISKEKPTIKPLIYKVVRG